ncbi:MAG: hypothetical protein A2Y91_06370 [Chloroflexi bacterium RBG_13_54_8]|nr:MAG: hypothetical protein A2Y91_06370 [Chloroflexi bacterium RBG_13_54_8]
MGRTMNPNMTLMLRGEMRVDTFGVDNPCEWKQDDRGDRALNSPGQYLADGNQGHWEGCEHASESPEDTVWPRLLS